MKNFKTFESLGLSFRVYQPHIPFTRNQRAWRQMKMLIKRLVDWAALMFTGAFLVIGAIALMYNMANLGWLSWITV